MSKIQDQAILLRITPKLPESLAGYDGDERVFWEIQPKPNKQEAIETTYSGLKVLESFFGDEFHLFFSFVCQDYFAGSDHGVSLLAFADMLVSDEDMSIQFLSDLRDWDAFRLLRCRHLGNKLDFNVKPLTKEISTQSMEIFSDVKSDTCSSTLSMMEVDEDSSTQSEHNRIRNLSTVTFGAAAQQNETQAAEDWRQEKSHLLEVVESANVRYDLLVGTLKTILNGNCTFPPIFQDDDEEELHVVQVPKSILKVPTVTGESSQSTAPSPTIRGTTSAKKINWDESVQLLEKLRQEKLRNEAFVFGYKINGTVDILTDEEMSSDEYENASSSDQSIDVVSRVQIDSLESFAKTAPSVSLFSGRRPRPPKEEINLPKSLDTQPVDLPPVTSPQPEPLKSIIPKSKLSKRLSTLKFWEKENSKTDVKKHTFDFKYKQTTSSNKTEKEHFVVDNQPQQNQIVPGNDISAMLMEDGEVQEQVVMELPGSPPIIENESLDVIDEGEISLKRPKPVIKKRFWGRNGKKEGKE